MPRNPLPEFLIVITFSDGSVLKRHAYGKREAKAAFKRHLHGAGRYGGSVEVYDEQNNPVSL